MRSKIIFGFRQPRRSLAPLASNERVSQQAPGHEARAVVDLCQTGALNFNVRRRHVPGWTIDQVSVHTALNLISSFSWKYPRQRYREKRQHGSEQHLNLLFLLPSFFRNRGCFCSQQLHLMISQAHSFKATHVIGEFVDTCVAPNTNFLLSQP